MQGRSPRRAAADGARAPRFGAGHNMLCPYEKSGVRTGTEQRAANPAKLCRVELDATVYFQRVASISTRQVCRVEMANIKAQRRPRSVAFGLEIGAALPSAFDTSQHELKVAWSGIEKSTDGGQIKDSSVARRLGLDFRTGEED
jgi:hypothetical protein